MTHTIPGISAVYLMYITDCVLIKRHAIFLFVFGTIYSVFNCYSCHKKGKPLYWFLDWINEPLKAAAIAMLVVTVFVSLFLFTVKLDERITGRTADKDRKLKSKGA